MGTILIVSGPPGAGKTTVSTLLAGQTLLSVHLRVDGIFGFVSNGFVLPWLAEADDQNRTMTRASAAAAVEYADGGYFTIVDGVVLPPMLALYREQPRPPAVELHYCVLRPFEDIVLERGMAWGDKPDTLSAEVYREMSRQFRDATIDARHILDSSLASPAGTAAEVARRLAAGELRSDAVER